MTKIYDNWERLVGAVALREQLRRTAYNHSRNSSAISSGSSDFDFDFDFGPTNSSFEESYVCDEESSDVHSGTTDDANEKRYSPPDNEEITSGLSSQNSNGVDEKAAGEIVYMVGAKELLILMRRNSQYWDWTSHADSRFSEVAMLHYGRCLDIRGRMQTRKLSQSTNYVAYLVFKLTGWSKGLESANAVVNFFDKESDRDAQKITHIAHLQPGKKQKGSTAMRRMDGWMEVEIGNFYVDGDDGAVEARIFEFTSWKMGLIVEGIEFRPLHHEAQTVYQQSIRIPMSKLIASNDMDEDNQESGSDMEVHEASVVAEIEDIKETEIDISLLQEFVPQSSELSPENPIPSDALSIPSHDQSEQKKRLLRRRTTIVDNANKPISTPTHEPTLEPMSSEADRFCPDWNLKSNSSLQDDGIGEEMMAKLLLPKDEPLLTSLTSEELFSGGYGCLSEVVYYFHGMKKMIEKKDRETDDLKQKLLKHEVEAQLALAAKESELEDLKKVIKVLKTEIEKAQNYAQEEVRTAAEKIKQVEGKLEKAEASAASAVENYKNSEELKLDKHKFASKAFSIGFEFCKKQVLEVDPDFDISRVDIKHLATPSSSIS